MASLLELLGQTWPARMAQGAWGAAKLPGDVYAGRADPLSDESIGRAADLAGMVMGGTYASAPRGAMGAGAVRPAPVRYLPDETGARAPTVQTNQSLFDLSRLREVPDVPQFNLQRYEPPRGIPERTQALATPENMARINEVVKRGEAMGGREWYNTEPLRQAFIGELGKEKGPAAYQQYLDLVAATSPRSKVGENVRNASYYYGLAQRGEPLPTRTGGALDAPLPSPYGHIAQRLHVQNAENVLGAGGWPVLQNPKPASFAQNLAGNQMPVTIDTHNIRLLGSELDKPAKTEYGFLERAQQKEAEKLGMTPAQYQASAWIGGGEQTGLKSTADPFVKVFEDRVKLTAKKTGLKPETVLRKMIRGEMPLLGAAGAAVLAGRDDEDKKSKVKIGNKTYEE